MDTTDALSRRPFVSDFVLLMLLLMSLAGNVYLGLRYVSVPSSSSTPRPSIATGVSLPTLGASRADGGPVLLHFDDQPKPTVLFVISPACPWCKRTWPQFKALASAERAKYRFLALSVADSAGDFSGSIETLSRPDVAFLRRVGITAVPLTLVVSTRGRVDKAWVGPYTDAIRSELTTYFGVPIQVAAQ